MMRAHAHAMAEQIAHPPHDGKPEAEAEAAFARLIADLMIFLENRLHFVFRNANAGIPDFDAQKSLAAAAAEQHLSRPGVFQGVGEQVAHHLFEQARIA